MKTILKTVFTTAVLLLIPSIIYACEITLVVDGNQKEKYAAGETVVVKVIVVLQHRKCDVDIDKTDITITGGQITGATKWVNTEGKTWERKLKVKVAANAEGKAVIAAGRECTKDGGKVQLTLLIEN